MIEPQGDEKKLPLTQTAPGRYVAEFPADKPGAYHVHITQQSKRTARHSTVAWVGGELR